MPRVLPPAWSREPDHRLVIGTMAAHFRSHWHMDVLVSIDEMDDARILHVSVTHKTRLPSWAELVEVKDLFIGRDVEAVQILPPAAEYVNLHRNCLHLWRRLDRRTLSW